MKARSTTWPAAGEQGRSAANVQAGAQCKPAAAAMPDARAASLAQLQHQQRASNSSQAAQLVARADMMAGRGADTAVQRIGDEELLQGKFAAQLEANPNNTGMPDQLKAGIESLSGMSMDHVKVHYNSEKPAQLNAHAYAQGSEIHMAPGQERHLPHEAWHVVQQMQGRVRPTTQLKGDVPVNDDIGLETEADVMGARAAIAGAWAPLGDNNVQQRHAAGQAVQLATEFEQIGRRISYETKRYVESGDDKLVVDGAESMYAASSGMAILDPDNPTQGTAVSDGPTKTGIYTNASYITSSNGNHVTRCHAINAKYGGLDRLINLFPQTKEVNDAHSDQAEEAVKAKIVAAAKINDDYDYDEAHDDHLSVGYSYAVEYPDFITPENFHQISIRWDTKYINGKDEDVDLSSIVIPKVDNALGDLGWGLRPDDRVIGEDEVMSEQEQDVSEASKVLPFSRRRFKTIQSILRKILSTIGEIEVEDTKHKYADDIAILRGVIKPPPAGASAEENFHLLDDHFHTIVSAWEELVDSLFVGKPNARERLHSSLEVTDV